ncbi:LuxR C-terminal-related transcriptional regulator [Streptomyces sp. NPDC058629]|uniref:LuxR C-terminal-related transcriptional regulator n=1 Tax=Streptomyces sp. NPDC058629 TaxID=3346565 RepID=UPI003653CBD4
MTSLSDSGVTTPYPELSGDGPDGPHRDTDLLEQQQAQRVLTSLLLALARGRSGVVTLAGRAGHAQNGLLRWATGRARSDGLRVLRAQAAPDDRDQPLGASAAFMTTMADRSESAGAFPATLDRIGTAPPTLVVMEDTQWLDPGSLSWLRALVLRLAPDTPVAVLTSGSGASADARSWLDPVVASSVPTQRLLVRGLTRQGVAAMVETVCDRPGDPRFVAAAATATDGNPAVLRDVLDRFTGLGHTPVAARLTELRTLADAAVGDHATRALSCLPAKSADLMRALAVGGDLLGFPLIRTLAGLEPESAQELRTMLGADGLIVTGGTRTQVRHPAIRNRVLEGMSAEERTRLHSRAAVLAHRAGADDEDTARVLLRTPPLGAPWVVTTLRRCFAKAMDAGDHSRATACLVRALREPLEPGQRTRLTMELAAAEAISAPLAGDRRLGELIGSGSAAAGLRAHAVDIGLARGNGDWARRTAAEALSRSRPDEKDGLTALFWLADDAMGDPGCALPAVPALPGRPSAPAQAGVRAWQLAVRGEDLTATRELARAALAGDSPYTAPALPRIAACRALVLTDDHEEADGELDRLLTALRRDHRRAAAAQALTVRADLAMRAGRFDAVERELDAADQALPAAKRHPLIAPAVTALRIHVALETGREASARALAAAPAPPGAERGMDWAALLFARARVFAHEKRWAETAELSKECGRRLLSAQWSNPALLSWRAQAAEALYALGDVDEAARLSAENARLSLRWGSASTLGLAHLWSAPLTGSGPGPAGGAREAVRVLRDSPSRLLYAWALVQVAAGQLESGDAAAARLSLARLSGLRAAYPSSRLAVSVNALAERLERPPGPAGPALPPEWMSLSEAEQRTATLAGCGHGNREIAALLSVSRRTVELRLSNAYRKLRLNGREELCRLTHDMGERSSDAS